MADAGRAAGADGGRGDRAPGVPCSPTTSDGVDLDRRVGEDRPTRPGRLERIRLHPYYTERALSMLAALAPIGAPAACHHERVNGSEDHRSRAGGRAVDVGPHSRRGRLVPRDDRGPDRTGRRWVPTEAARRVRDDVRDGRLDGADAAEACCGSPATDRSPCQRANVGGLTSREVEVLRLAAAGGSIKSMASALLIAPKTADAHLQHIYSELGADLRGPAPSSSRSTTDSSQRFGTIADTSRRAPARSVGARCGRPNFRQSERRPRRPTCSKRSSGCSH